MASGLTHRVKRPRACKARSYSLQFFTLDCALGSLWRRASITGWGIDGFGQRFSSYPAILMESYQRIYAPTPLTYHNTHPALMGRGMKSEPPNNRATPLGTESLKSSGQDGVATITLHSPEAAPYKFSVAVSSSSGSRNLS
jgi:hypothetical protein